MVSRLILFGFLTLIWRYIKQWDSMELLVQKVCSWSSSGYIQFSLPGFGFFSHSSWFLSWGDGHRSGGDYGGIFGIPKFRMDDFDSIAYISRCLSWFCIHRNIL